MDSVKISEENIANIVKVFLLGINSKSRKTNLISDGNTHCTWNSVFKLRRSILYLLLHSNAILNALGSILKILWSDKE